MNIIKRLFGDFSSFLGKKNFFFVVFFGIFTAGVGAFEPIFFSKILSLVEDIFKTGAYEQKLLFEYLFLWGCFILFVIAIEYINRYFIVDKNILKFYTFIVQENIAKMVDISYGNYLGKKQGETFKIFERGRSHIMNFLFWFFLSCISTITLILSVFFIMLFINITMTLIVFSLVPIAIYIGLFFGNKTTKLQKENNDSEDHIVGQASDHLTNLSLVKILNLQFSFQKRFKKESQDILERQYSISQRWTIAHIYIEVLIMILRLFVLGIGIFMIQNGSLTLAELFLFFAYIGWVYYPIGQMFGSLRQIQEQILGIGKFYKEFYDTIELEDISQGKEMSKITGNIVFQNVFFSYNAERKILKNISFEVKSGEKIALVGNTGAGKSTIAHLLLRFWDYDSGQILLDGTPIHEIKKSSLRHHVGVVSQDTSLFNLSIEENLKFANPKATKKQIEEALKSAQAEFVFDFPAGIKTIIGERGLKLSGGEKQRIALARLFLKNPEILILDEATSALDTTTEKKVDLALKNLMKGKTSIIIAHRLSTIRHVDRIFVLEQGKVVEAGNYQELMEKKGRFFALANPDKLILG